MKSNHSEKDPQICKNRQRMADGFLTETGRQIYCNIIRLIETINEWD
jgi:hypothetical protein